MRNRRTLLLVLAVAGSSAAGVAASLFAPVADSGDARPAPEVPPIVVVAGEFDRSNQFWGVGDLFVVNPDGTGLRRLRAWPARRVRQPFGTADANWSPDGKRIGLVLAIPEAEFDVLGQLAVLSADGRELRTLAAARTDEPRVAWSPDGRSLAYVGGLPRHLWMVTADRARRTRLSRNPAYFVGPCWVDGGRAVAASVSQRRIVKLSRARSRPTLVAPTAGDYYEFLACSPQGTKIAFTRFNALYVVSAKGGRVKRLASMVEEPLWSPDGRLLAFSRIRPRARGISVSAADGSSRRVLTSGPDRALGWSPDGSRILFERERRRSSEIWVVDADGGGQTRLPLDPDLLVIAADWRPN